MNVQIKVKDQAVQAKINNLIKQMPAEASKATLKAATALEAQIKKRVSRGQGVRGIMKPYSLGYAKFRAKKGRQTNVVDLNFTGRMLGSMQAMRSSGVSSKVAFTSVAQSRKAYFTDQRRDWFGVDTNGRKAVMTAFLRHFRARNLI